MNEGIKFTQTIWTTVSDAGTSNNIHLNECNPVKKTNNPKLYIFCDNSITRAVLLLTAWFDSASTAKNLLTCLLKMDPAYRMSASQLLENPWITVRRRFVPAACTHISKWVTREALTECFVQQGDTNMPALPYNVLEMMRNYLEESDSKTIRGNVLVFKPVTRWVVTWCNLRSLLIGRKSQGESSLTFSEEKVDVVAGAASSETSDCRCHTELKSESDSCSPPTSEKVVLCLHFYNKVTSWTYAFPPLI